MNIINSTKRGKRQPNLGVPLAIRYLTYAVLIALIMRICYNFIGNSSSSSSSSNEEGHGIPSILALSSTETSSSGYSASTTYLPLPLSLDELTKSAETPSSSSSSCPNDNKGFVYIDNVIRNSNVNTKPPPTTFKGIPRFIHQTSKSRCMTSTFANDAISKWQQFGIGGQYNYYFHDDMAMQRLLEHPLTKQQFPMLERVASNCIIHGTMKSDLWRYLVLWTYGGIYADVDTIPNPNAMHNLTSILSSSTQNNMDGLFVIEQYHLLSQYFMAISPKHPLMYYAIQFSLMNLMSVSDTGSTPASMVSGPHALHAAFQSFQYDVGNVIDPATAGYKPVKAGTYVGTHNRTIHAIGYASNQNEYIIRDVLKNRKRQEYAKMQMRHFQDDKKYPSHKSCLRSMYEKEIQRVE